MALDDNIDAVRDLQNSGTHVARLLGYMNIGVLPSRENMTNAQQWLSKASDKLEPILQEAEANKASPPQRPTFKG
ncbi:hypothetical protein [Paraburkholderia sp. BCC1885]|jgi:hypothetical protein|uniref:hypothetical protein n=1 Tax=Paraburkholderia sp. BCC1885 TaxID=2562669 RepID=UPI00118426CD|nr:hypothetical protein [Paraburkholderia sp. BCC1885]